MEITDSKTFGQFAVNRGLVTPEQVAEATDIAQLESGQTVPDLIFLSRAMEKKGFITGLHTSKLMRGDPDGYFMGRYR
ncbi:MAG: hypothetical protein K2W96_10480, partial [Gemmataceae bacterium]|nr:hypothetical protein [Gemmataceae bacterium]